MTAWEPHLRKKTRWMWGFAEYWDDLSGAVLNSDLVRKARKEELEEFGKHKVYFKVPLAKCVAETGKKPLGIRWVDVNKGDGRNPEYRSRLVAKEIKMDKQFDMFAALPFIKCAHPVWHGL